MVFINLRQKLINIFYDSLFKNLEFETVLDVGSGNGKMLDYFFSRGKKASGVDLFPARKEIQKVDILNNSIPDNQYDLVFSAHLIEHLKEPEKFVAELLRISKKFICIITPLPTKSFWNQPDHVRPYTAETLKRIFHLNNAIACKEINFPFFEPIAVILFSKMDSRLII